MSHEPELTPTIFRPSKGRLLAGLAAVTTVPLLIASVTGGIASAAPTNVKAQIGLVTKQGSVAGPQAIALAGGTAPQVVIPGGSLYAATAVPDVSTVYDPSQVEVGVKFVPTATGQVSSLRFFKGPRNTGVHTGSLWSSAGSRLATVQFGAESAVGWQTATLSTPVTVTAGATYTASYHTATGYYSDQENTFASGATINRSGLVASAGVYHYGASAYPTQSWHGSSYYVDVTYSPLGAPAPTPTPTPTTPSPTPTPVSTTPTPTPTTPSPTPTPTPPPATGYPNAASTGYTGTLKAVPGQVSSGPGWSWNPQGWVSITGANTVFSGYAVTGAIEVYAPNVTIHNNDIVESGSGWAIGLRPGVSHTIISDNSIHGQSQSTGRLVYGIFNVNGNDSNLQVLRNDIYWTAHGIQVERGLVQDNWIHSMGFIAGDHTECMFSGGGDTGQLTIRHNSLTDEKDQVAAIILSNAFGKQMNRTIDNNLLAGGGYTVYGGNSVSHGAANLVVTNNKFSAAVWPKGGYYGSPVINFSTNQPGNIWSNNTWYDGSLAGKVIAAVL